MSSIGSALKEARNKKSISLEEVHSRIKIHPRVLQLLEEDKFEKLPSPLFVKSFLKSYAEFLEINPEELVRAYELTGMKEPAQVLYIKPVDLSGTKSFFDFDKSLLVIPALILALVLGGGAIFHLAKNAANHLKQTKVSKVIKPLQSKSAKMKKTDTVPAKTALAVEDGFNASDWLRHPLLGNFPKIGKKEALRLKIKGLDSVWLRVKSDGKVLFQSIVKRGVVETWTANDHFELWTGNASSMELTLNEYDLGSPGKAVTKKMLINREGVRITA
ncbi:MAG: hypothetical protein COT00_04270 [Candidatus Omnitrophica bacterium CG07_land_8_20_14_0_80_50_8]|nr:MAG: hypothetical protein AUJ71_04025 [Candidatus Omnitrophica bacterium CG1_02_49_16]PIU39949.1 MAG: hypothetical protein COT00_04270 [Candidatus Omnitrophica bacterium CG07_land_8_20_14_0_80_50_8]